MDKYSHLSPSNPKIPSWPKIPSFVDTPKCPAWRNALALGYGTAWDHYQMENFLHPTLKYPAAPKIPSSVDATKYPAWSLFGHGTAWDNYKMENFLHPTLKNPSASTYPALSTPKIHSLEFSNLTSLTLWDHYKMENYLHPTPKYPSLSIQTHPVWSLFVDIPWLRDMIAWDHYKMEKLSPSYPARKHPTAVRWKPATPRKS